jgi:hypothetical protein
MADAVLDPNAQGIAATDPYLAQGGAETLDSLRKRFAGMISQGGFSQGDVSNGALANKLGSMGAQKMDDINSTFDRNMPFLYSQRQAGFQDVNAKNLEILRQEELARKQAQAAKDAKRRGLVTGVLGLAGAGAGAYFSGGNPAAAQAGAGAGAYLGSQF